MRREEMALVHQNRPQFCNDSDLKNVDMVHSLRDPTGVSGQRECIVPKGASRKLFLHSHKKIDRICD